MKPVCDQGHPELCKRSEKILEITGYLDLRDAA
jgi:hypothetical protein